MGKPWKFELLHKNTHAVNSQLQGRSICAHSTDFGLGCVTCFVLLVGGVYVTTCCPWAWPLTWIGLRDISGNDASKDSKCPIALLLVSWEEHMPVNSLVQRGDLYQADIDPTNSMKPSPTDPSLNQQNHSSSAAVSGEWERISDYSFKLLNLVSFVMEEELTDKEPKQSQSKSLHY